MTQDQIIRMAREAGITVYNNEIQSVECESNHLERFAALVAEATKAQPQGKPVAWLRINAQGRVEALNHEVTMDAFPVYRYPPSVEAAIEAALEKAAKLLEDGVLGHGECAAAIRSMK